MMNRSLLFVLTILLGMLGLTACSDGDNAEAVQTDDAYDLTAARYRQIFRLKEGDDDYEKWVSDACEYYIYYGPVGHTELFREYPIFAEPYDPQAITDVTAELCVDYMAKKQ